MFIYAISFKTHDAYKMRQLFRHLLELLPCPSCRKYALQVLWFKYPLNLNSRMEFFESVYIWKSLVNKKLGKPNMRFESVLQRYTNKLA